MKQIYYEYANPSHCNDCHTGCGQCPPPTRCPGPHPRYPGPGPCHPHHPHHYGKVGIIGRLVLSVKFIDHHGHVQYFDIDPTKTYAIEAISQTKGKCVFAGRIVDFDSAKGIEKIMTPPHIIDIASIVVDYSDDYQAKLIRIGVDNIISIKPIEKIEDVNPRMFCPDECYIDDPFAQQQVYYNTSQAENLYQGG